MTIELQKKIVDRKDFNAITSEGWYNVNLGAFTLDFYFRPSEFKRAWIFSPGWLDRKQFPVPYFQRAKWFSSLEGVGLSLSDPSLALDEDIQVGWFLGNDKTDYLYETAKYIGELLEFMGIPKEQINFFGSSAGGFSSLGFATYLRGSRALVVNPQTDLFRFHNIPELGKIIRSGFYSRNTTQINTEYPWRFSIYALFKKENYTPPCLIMINTADDWHVSEHVAPLLANLSGHALSNELTVKFFYDMDMGHNPPGPQIMLPIMEKFSHRYA
jgi:hypothetical protein